MFFESYGYKLLIFCYLCIHVFLSDYETKIYHLHKNFPVEEK